MKPKRKILPALCTGTAMTILISSFPAYAQETVTESQVAFEAIVDSFYNDMIAMAPLNLHFYQSSTENLPFSLEQPFGDSSVGIEEQQALFSELQTSLESLNYQELTRHQKQVYLQLKNYTELNLALLELPDYYNLLGPIDGFLSSANTLIAEYYLLSEDDIVNYIAILNDLPRALKEVLAEIDQKESLGFPIFSYSCQKLLDLREEMTTLEGHPYLESFINNLQECAVSEETAASYTEQVSAVLRDTVIPALSEYFDAVAQKAETAVESQGLCAFDQGQEYFTILAQSYTGTDMTVDEMMSYLYDKLDEDITSYNQVYYSHPSVMDEFETISLPYDDPQEVLSLLNEKMQTVFPKIENSDFILSYLPEALQIEGNLAYYLQPPFDLPSRNIIRINGSAVDDDSITLWTTLAHEGFPGHLYQKQYYRENRMQYPIESILDCLTTSEGWATYVQRLALDWTDLDKDLADFYWYNFSIGIAVSSILDIGVNYYGWDTSEVQSFLSDYYGDVDTEIAQDYLDTFANDPGVYLPYSFGYYLVDDLFDSIKGSYSTESAMYTAFLNYSILPFSLLERYLGADGSI